MKLRHVLIITAIVALVFGIAFLFAPVWTMELFDITLDDGGALMTQLVAAGFLAFAVLNWMGRNYKVADDVRPIIVANLFANVIGFVVCLIQRLNDVGNAWGWVPIALYLLFALAFGYSLAVRSTYEEPVVRTRPAM
jgi:hypothetical protein